MDELRILSVCGNLGYGIPETSLENVCLANSLVRR
jgi:hypothetical protein